MVDVAKRYEWPKVAMWPLEVRASFFVLAAMIDGRKLQLNTFFICPM